MESQGDMGSWDWVVDQGNLFCSEALYPFEFLLVLVKGYDASARVSMAFEYLDG